MINHTWDHFLSFFLYLYSLSFSPPNIEFREQWLLILLLNFWAPYALFVKFVEPQNIVHRQFQQFYTSPWISSDGTLPLLSFTVLASAYSSLKLVKTIENYSIHNTLFIQYSSWKKPLSLTLVRGKNMVILDYVELINTSPYWSWQIMFYTSFQLLNS